jgi:hypothetical protein
MIERPHPSRLAPSRPDYDAIIAAHDQAVTAGRDSYIDPSSGLTVLTVSAHIARGTCCASGCRHCPYVKK